MTKSLCDNFKFLSPEANLETSLIFKSLNFWKYFKFFMNFIQILHIMIICTNHRHFLIF